jgi:conjugative transfer signal peptidase TraF
MNGCGSRLVALGVGGVSTATAMLALVLVHRSGLRFNITGSIPIGVYRVVDDTAPLRRGDVVLACLPESVARLAHDRGYVPRGGSCPQALVPVGKMVMALAGDTVVVSSDGLHVNGRLVQNSRPLVQDAAGRELRGIPSGHYLVSTGDVWLIGVSPRSFDCRYIGPVPIKNVIARLARN